MNANASASDGFRARCEPIWRGLHEHPFINELAAGTLPLEKFRFFLEQDDFYLEEYARCLAMGAARSRTQAELRYFTTDLNQVLDAELPSNQTLLDQRHRDAAPPIAADPRRWRPRTSHTRATCSHSPFAGARSRSWRPCSRAPGATSRSPPTFAHAPTWTHPAYGGWIAYFSLPSNVEMVTAMRRDFDALVVEEAGDRGAARPYRADLRDELAPGTVVLGHGVHAGAVARPRRELIPEGRRRRESHVGLPRRPRSSTGRQVVVRGDRGRVDRRVQQSVVEHPVTERLPARPG